MGISLILYILSLAVLIYLSGRFSGTETALTSLSDMDVAQMRYHGAKNLKYIERLREEIDRTIIVILVGNNLVNVSASSLAALLFQELLGNLGVSISVGVMTLLLLVFGEVTPKAYAIKNSRKISKRNAKMIYYLSVILKGLVTLLKKTSRTLIRLMGGSVTKEDFQLQEVNIKFLAKKGADTGEIKTIEKDIIHRVFKFGDLHVRDVMIDAEEVEYLDVEQSVVDAKKEMVYHGYTRLPVVDPEKIKIMGTIYTKDLLNRMEGKVKDFMRKPYIVSPDVELTQVFEKMRSERVHLGIVADERRKFKGIITLEDILEQLVGEIYDEYDVIDKEGSGSKIHHSAGEERRRIKGIRETEVVEFRSSEQNSTNEKIEAIKEELGISGRIARRLFTAGYEDTDSLAHTTPGELRAIKGINPTAARNVFDKAKEEQSE